MVLSLDLKLWLFAAIWFSSIANGDTEESQALRDSALSANLFHAC